MKKLIPALATLCAFICTALPSSLQATEVQSHSFIHINSENGLSQSNVKAILQDSYGFMWFGTKNGLNRYDGKEVVLFNCNDEKKHRSNHNISALFEDRDKTIWVGTDEGIFLYNPANEEFSFFDTKTEKGISANSWVSCFRTDKDGALWIDVPSQGIFKYKDGRLKLYEFTDLPHPHELYICDNNEIYAVAWYAGFYKYNASKDRFEQITTDAHGRSLLNIETNTLSQQGDYLIMAVQNGDLMKYDFKRNVLENIPMLDFGHTFVRNAAAFGDEIWVCTYDGLYILNEKKGCFKHFDSNPLNPDGLTDNIIYSLYRDREGGTWVGTMFGGVNYLPHRSFGFTKYISELFDSGLSSKRIREMARDTHGNIWIGTEDAGINILSPDKGRITHYKPVNSRYDTHVTLAIGAFGDKVYCSLFKDGLEVIGSDGKSKFYSNKELGIASESNSIYAFYIDRAGNIWMGTDNGVYKASNGTFKFSPVKELKPYWYFDIMEDNHGTLWFATMGQGLLTYNPATKAVKHYMYEDNNPSALSSNSVSSIMQDSKGRVWISTDRGGICRYNPKSDDFTRFSIEEGLPDDVAYKILEDNRGYLWFGTNQGLVRFQPDTKSIRVFTVKDGLCGNQFNYKSAVKDTNGRFYFGGIEGLVSFNPDIDEDTTATPPLYITQLSIFNEEVSVHSSQSPLTKSIIETDKIVLPHNRANIGLNVALLSYATAPSNEYAYRLDPVDDHWIETGTRNHISYANLAPGKYTLHIKGTNNGNFENAATRSITIVVLPPWYATVWAYFAYVIIAIGIFTYWFLWYRKHKEKQFAEKQRLYQSEKEKELNKNKIEFFTEIAHEIRTPLTLINGPLEIIREMNIQDSKLQKNLDVITQNTKRLLYLASQLLDFQKMSAHKLSLTYETVNVSQLLKETVERFEPTYTHQQKELAIKTLEENVIARIDKEAITKILSNLLNNGLKYGHQHVSVSLVCHQDNFVITVTSDGEKIPNDKAEVIFEPFYQRNTIQKDGIRQGAGIGLALARSLALLHKGTLYVDTAQQDNAFVLSIPINMDGEIAIPDTPEDNEPLNDSILTDENAKGNAILIVEDEANILDMMKERLSEEFIVETAANGQEALEVLHRDHIDLVVSDIMMPVMNGIELCRNVKTDLNLCHIPFIFLTAKNDLDSKIQGLKAGAEAYIEKPFSFNYFKAQVMSLLSNRQKEREAFSKRPFFPTQNMQMSKEDEEFMQRVIDTVYKFIDDEQFNVERMAEELCMSRSSLLRKIKTLFNLSPIDFIRLIRLKKAAELIQEGKYRVGEICTMVGFNSHSYFSKLFFKQFGMTPKDFEKQMQNMRDKNRAMQDINIEELIQRNNTNS